MSPPMPMAVTKSDTLLEYVTVAASVLQNIADCSDVPFLHTISSLSIAILKTVDSVKTNKHECALMIDYIHKIQYSIINICMGSETGRILTPTVLHRLAFFSETLQKIYSLMQTQLEMNKLKRFLRQKELSAQLEDCNTRLQDTLHFLSVSVTAHGKINFIWTLDTMRSRYDIVTF
ncbi:hypothetical protein B0H10DRAFT_367362 [Mycena sp. CBHHK59/15]|nr:hypothetical protein B0H10DRAFT_367362 [Mycena sp. CBHHK59/15]